ncbi:MAG: hypothetical protein R3C18_07220 [Planctomycetaceae bacterium]
MFPHKFPLALAAILALFVATAFADEPATAEQAELDPVQELADFAETNLVGRVVETTVKSHINGQALDSEFTRRTVFVKVTKVDKAVAIDVLYLIKQTLWDLDDAGNRIEDSARVEDRVSGSRWVIHRSLSTGKLLGSTAGLIGSNGHGLGGGRSDMEVKLENGKLWVRTTHGLYGDGFSRSGEYTPIASVGTRAFWLEGEVLVGESTEFGYNVDPETLERTPSGHDVKLKEQEVPSIF